MTRFIIILSLALPSTLFAQAYKTDAYYQQSLKKLDSVKSIAPDSITMPSIQDLDSSTAANEYLHLACVAAFRWEVSHCHDKEELKRHMEKVFVLPFDSITNAGRQYGDDYLVWLYARHILSPALQERLLIDRLRWYTNEEWLPQARQFFSDLELYFPNSSYISGAKARIQVLESKVVAGKNNVHIIFRAPVHSLNDLITPYKGKVVYLDIWGTWCGPCREEMKYAGALKQHIDTAKVAFLYLDMDADEQDSKWREFVQEHGITGDHLRMNENDLEIIWEALLHTHGVSRLYPSFFIFGKDGKLLQVNAKRPSDTTTLYKQLEEAASHL